MGKGDDHPQCHGIANPAARTDQVGGHHRLAMTGTESVPCAVDDGEQQRHQNFPRRCFAEHDRLDDASDLLLLALLVRVRIHAGRKWPRPHRLLSSGGLGVQGWNRARQCAQLLGGRSRIVEGIEAGGALKKVEDRCSAGGSDEGSLVLECFWSGIEDEEGEVGIVILHRDPAELTGSLIEKGAISPVKPPATAHRTLWRQHLGESSAEGEVGIEGAGAYRSLQPRLLDQQQFQCDRLAIDAQVEERQERVNLCLEVGSPLIFLDSLVPIGIQICQYRKSRRHTPAQIEQDRHLAISDGECGLGTDTGSQFMSEAGTRSATADHQRHDDSSEQPGDRSVAQHGSHSSSGGEIGVTGAYPTTSCFSPHSSNRTEIRFEAPCPCARTMTPRPRISWRIQHPG